MTARTWWTTVGFGGTSSAPVGPWPDPELARQSLTRWAQRKGYRAGTIIAAHTLRVNGYRSRAAARDGDISDGPGRHGCVSITGLNDFLAGMGQD